MRCANCHSDNPSQFQFCGKCGTALAGAERHHLTVMFCEVVNPTTLSEQLDPEDFHDVITTYQETCSAIVRRFSGYVARQIGGALPEGARIAQMGIHGAELIAVIPAQPNGSEVDTARLWSLRPHSQAEAIRTRWTARNQSKLRLKDQSKSAQPHFPKRRTHPSSTASAAEATLKTSDGLWIFKEKIFMGRS